MGAALTAGAALSLSGAALSLGVVLLPLGAPQAAPPEGPELFPVRDRDGISVRHLAVSGILPWSAWTLRPATRTELSRFLDLSEDGTVGEGGTDTATEDGTETGTAAGTAERIVTKHALGVPERARLQRELAAEPWLRWPAGAGEIRVRPYLWLDAAWVEDDGWDWGPQPRFGLEGTAHLSDRFVLHQNLFAGDVEDGRRFGDALVNHTDFLLLLESVYGMYAFDHGFVRMGRTHHAWGPGRFDNLLIASTAPAIDHFEFGLDILPIRFRSMVGVLSPASEKNIALHRVELSLHPSVQIGLTEGAVFHGSPLQPLYVVGIVPYTVVERLQGQDVFREGPLSEVRNNVIYQGDVIWSFADGGAAWVEFLLDDVATENADQPTRLGFLLGAEQAVPARHGLWRFGFEASKIYDFTYSVYYDDSNWTHQGRSLGARFGPDSENARIFCEFSPSPNYSLGLGLLAIRQGEGQLGRPWYPLSDPRSEGNPDSPASELTGTVEETTGFDLSVQAYPTASLRFGSRLRWMTVDNAENVEGARDDAWRLDAWFEWHR